MTVMDLGPPFIAGIASFLSPCVLPLVPGYISLMSGLSLEQLKEGSSANQKNIHINAGLCSLCFVLGFALVFTALGASASALGALLTRHMEFLSKIAGAVIILFGLHTMGLVPIRWLYYEKRLKPGSLQPGCAGAFLMGLAFAFGWTPCIGPILAGILALAATQETVRSGMLLLFVYSLGLGLPFIAAGCSVPAFLRFFGRYKRYIRWGEIFAGGLLILVGALVFSNRLSLLIRLLPRSLYKFAM